MNPTYLRVLKKLAGRLGQTLDELQDSDFLLLRGFIAQRLREAWEAWKWPDLMRLEERAYREGFWAAGQYAAGAIVYYVPEASYFENTSGGNTTEEPTAGTDWEQRPAEDVDAFQRYIPRNQAGFDIMGEVYNAWRADPRLQGKYTAREVPYDLYTSLVDFGPDSVDLPFVYYRVRPWDYMGEKLDDTLDYVAGVEVLDYLGTGKYYITTDTVAAGQTPTTHPQKFEAEEFPYIFEDYVVYAAYSDWLEQEERAIESTQMARKATHRLHDEMVKVFKQQGQLPSVRVRNPRRPIYGGISNRITGLSVG